MVLKVLYRQRHPDPVSISWYLVLSVTLGWFLVASVRFAVEQWRVVRLGVTSFELDHHIKVGRP